MTTIGPDDREPPVGADVDRTWRALSREEPSASLDASILAAARRAAGAHPQAIDARESIAERRRWWPLAAAATVAAIAVGVLQLTPPEHLGAPSAETATDMPAPMAQKPEAVPTAPTAQAGAASAVEADAAPVVKADATSAAPPVAAAPAPPTASRGDREAMRQRQEARPAPPASFAPAPEPFPATPKRVDEGANVSAVPPSAPPAQSARKEAPAAAAPPPPPAATGSVAAKQAAAAPAGAAIAAAPDARKAESAAPAAAPMAKMAASRATDATSAARVKDRAPLPIPDWIALIRRLRDEGQTAEAAKELAAFRVAHADHEKLLPPDLRDWHPPEK